MATDENRKKGLRPTARFHMDCENKQKEVGAAWQAKSGNGHSGQLFGNVVEKNGVLMMARERVNPHTGEVKSLFTHIARLVEVDGRIKLEFYGDIFLDDVTDHPDSLLAH
ncbi:MAG: hypothetical protein HRT81_12810 [Henriciella sp.]|nr:hypothetical protein [Henriciella sp.]